MAQLTALDDCPDTFITPLSDHGLIFLQGEEKQSYLQGQITQDANALDDTHARFSSHCDFKGKTWSLFIAFEWQDQVVLLGHQGGLSTSLPELKKYGVFSKVDIRDTTNEFRIIGGAGSQLEAWIEQHFGGLPSEHLAMINSDSGAVIRIDFNRPHYYLMLTPEQAEALTSALADQITNNAMWQAAQIQAGWPEITEATSNEFVPQMMNVHALDGIHFKKGCYMGQEVVARTKFLGRNKRAAFILKGDGEQPLNPGDTLERQVGDNWRRGGTVLSCAALKAETWLLAVLPNDTEVGAIMRSKTEPAHHFEVQPLPYTLDDQ